MNLRILVHFCRLSCRHHDVAVVGKDEDVLCVYTVKRFDKFVGGGIMSLTAAYYNVTTELAEEIFKSVTAGNSYYAVFLALTHGGGLFFAVL